MSLKAQIQADLKLAMKSADKARVRILRMITAAIKQREVDERIELDEPQTLAVLEKMLKQRKDAAKQYKSAKRDDLAAVEEKEIAVITDFMPKALAQDEVIKLIKSAIADTNAISIKDMGKVMGVIKPKVQGRVDMGELSSKVRDLLTKE